VSASLFLQMVEFWTSFWMACFHSILWCLLSCV
jgi:hypothetical protein